MKKYILLAALAATAFAGTAQQTMYLIKGTNVVAKYNVGDVDYVSFTLPDGVTDLPSEGGQVVSKNYISAAPVYHGTANECGQFQVQFSTKGITDENPPFDMLYLDFTTPKVTDLKDITIAEGTYTLGAADAIAPFKFYPGVTVEAEGVELPAGSLVYERADNDEASAVYTYVTDGSFTVKKEGSQYTISGMLKLENDNVLEFTYAGPMVVNNVSGEQPPAEDLPLPESCLTEDHTFTPLASECYLINYKNLFADLPNLEYYVFSMYGDSNYADCLDVAVVVDRTKYPDVLVPKGTYKMINRNDGSLAATPFGAVPAFKVEGDMAIGTYGCWLTLQYADTAPLIGGEVEILEDIVSWSDVKLRVRLTDNAETPHTVTSEFSGAVTPL